MAPPSHPHSPSTSASRPSTSGSALSYLSTRPASPGLGLRPRPLAAPADSSTSSPINIATAQPEPSSQHSSPSVSHRSSYADNLRSYPPSPRAQRTSSFSSAALTELLMSPSATSNGRDERFAGRDWRTIHVAEIIDPAEVRFVELETTIEDTTKLLIRSGPPNVVLVRDSTKTRTPIGTFDYSDLNAYLLLVLGLSQPDELAQQLAERARRGDPIPLRDLNDHLGAREEPAFLPHSANLTRAMELLGSGMHRVVITKEGTREAIGVLSQLRLVRFFWDNHRSFAATETLYALSLQELRLGQKEVLAINGDKPLADALRLMHDEGVTSLPVLDNARHVVGNISHVDVRLLTDTSTLPLLRASCIHFISVILSERGLLDGKDSYPVFHVTPTSTLAHTVAKLCATRSHRMWIVDAPSPSSSIPPSPGPHHVAPSFSMQNSNTHATSPPPRGRPGSIVGPPSGEVTPGPPYTPTSPGISVSAAQLPGQGISGRLTGVVSLTDILNLFARASGLSPGDPEEMRRRRRRSSSTSSRPYPDSMRASAEFMRPSGELGRSSSTSSRR